MLLVKHAMNPPPVLSRHTTRKSIGTKCGSECSQPTQQHTSQTQTTLTLIERAGTYYDSDVILWTKSRRWTSTFDALVLAITGPQDAMPHAEPYRYSSSGMIGEADTCARTRELMRGDFRRDTDEALCMIGHSMHPVFRTAAARVANPTAAGR